MLNYDNLIAKTPTVYSKFTNSLGQEIEFVEHPTKGEDYPVICVCHALKLAAASTFYETVDMLADHKEYEPTFQEGKFYIGKFLED
jgi:hypothetical protein